MVCNIKLNNCSDNTMGGREEAWRAPEFDPSAKNISLMIVLVVLDVVTIFGNLLVLISFAIEKRLRQPFNLFIFNLAVTDFSVAITAMTFYTIDTVLGYWPFGYIMCGVWIYFDFAMTFASVFTLVAISIDRFWCVTWAIHYRMHNNRTKTIIILALIWLCVVVIWTPPFIGDRLTHNEEHFCIWEPSDNRQFVLFVAVIGHYIPCIIMVFCYFKVFYAMKQQTSRVGARRIETGNGSNGLPEVDETKMKQDIEDVAYKTDKVPPNTHYLSTISHNSSCKYGSELEHHSLSQAGSSHDERSLTKSSQATNKVSSVQNRERKIFVTLTYVLSSYLICWFPFYIAFDTYAWRPELVPDELYTFFFWMTYVNSSLNPFIYAYTSKEFRTAFVRALRCLYKCHM